MTTHRPKRLSPLDWAKWTAMTGVLLGVLWTPAVGVFDWWEGRQATHSDKIEQVRTDIQALREKTIQLDGANALAKQDADALHREISLFRDDMVKRFDRVEKKLDSLQSLPGSAQLPADHPSRN